MIVACFPFVFSRLLEFVALFGILLSPVGAIVFVEHWIFPRLGFRQFWFRETGKSVSWPAVGAWSVSVITALCLWYFEILHMFFIAVPLWFLSAAVYTGFAAMAGAKNSVTGSSESVAGSASDTAPTARSGEAPAKPPWLYAVGAVGAVTLVIAAVLPFGLLFAGAADLQQQAERFQFWLGLVSLIHLATVACWVLVSERYAGDS